MAEAAPPQQPPAAFETEKPATQSKDASMGYPVAVATPATPPSATTVPNKRPKTWLYGTTVGLALLCILGQALFMAGKLTVYDRESYYSGYYPPSSYPGSSGYTPMSSSSSPSSTAGATPSLRYASTTFDAFNDIGTRRLSSAVEPPAASRKLLGDTKSSSKSSKKKKTKFGGGGGSDDDEFDYSGRSVTIRGTQVAKAPGMVIAAAVIALVAATAFLVLLFLPRFTGSMWVVIAEAVAVPIVLMLWLVAMAVSAKSASVLRKYFKDVGPKAWPAGNAIALTCSLLSLFVWGALLWFAFQQLLVLLRARKAASPAAPAAAKKDPAAAPAAAHDSASYAAGVPAAVQNAAYAAAATADVPAAPNAAAYPPAPPAAAYPAPTPAPAPAAYPPAPYAAAPPAGPAAPGAAYPPAAGAPAAYNTAAYPQQ